MNVVRFWREWILDYLPKSGPLLLEMKVRSSIFIITGVCAGLPSLVWSVSDIIHHRKNGHRISIFIILLLLTDFLELFLSPYILIKLLLDEIPHYRDGIRWTFLNLSWAMKDCGLLLNQLLALEGMITMKCTASVFSSPCFKLLIFLCVIFCHCFFLQYFFPGFLWEIVLFMFIVSLIPIIITCGTLCCAVRHPYTSRKSHCHVLVIFIFTLMVVYLPYAVIFKEYIHSLYKLYFRSFIFSIVFLLLSLRLISDPLLCVLVCRQNLSLQTSKKPEGLV